MELTEVVQKIKNNLINDGKTILLYAFNATGKTRMSVELTKDNDTEDNKTVVLCYNAILEDYFIWDNEDYVFNINKYSWITQLIKDQGLENIIIDNFKRIADTNIEPKFYLDSGNIEFIIPTGGKDTVKNIKISKGEEALFKWTIFYTILNDAIDNLKEKVENRPTDFYNNIKYIVIDDPVSSIDDYRIYSVAMDIIEVQQKINEINQTKQILHLPILITTHHALFYNILYNSFKNNEKKYLFYYLNKDNNNLFLENHNSDKPFAYHLFVIKEIKKAVCENNVDITYFNMFRSLLEKTAVFLGKQKWQDLFDDYDNKNRINKVLNMNSHGRNPDISSTFIENEQIIIFKEGFEWFINKYKFVF